MRRPAICFHDIAAAAVDDAFAGDGQVTELIRRKPARVSTPASRGNVQPSCVPRSRRVVLPSRTMRPSALRPAALLAMSNFVFELADDLLEDVFGGHNPDRRPEFVDDHRDLAAAFLEFLQEFDGELGLGDDEDVAHDLAKGEAGVHGSAEAEGNGAKVHEAGDVLGVDNADDAVGVRRPSRSALANLVKPGRGNAAPRRCGQRRARWACRRGERRFCRGGS